MSRRKERNLPVARANPGSNKHQPGAATARRADGCDSRPAQWRKIPSANFAQGYKYDGGWMATTGIPSREIGTSSANVGARKLWRQHSRHFRLFVPVSARSRRISTLSFDFSNEIATGAPGTILNPVSPIVTASTSLDITHFVNYGHKIIWYHGCERSWPARSRTISITTKQMAEQFGGIEQRPELLAVLWCSEYGPLHGRPDDRRI